MSQLTICCKQTEMLFDSFKCNSRGKIGKLRDYQFNANVVPGFRGYTWLYCFWKLSTLEKDIYVRPPFIILFISYWKTCSRTCQTRIYYITCIPMWINKIPLPGSNWNLERLLWEGMKVKREKMEYQFQDKYFLEQSSELTTISVMTKLDWTIFWANACTI